jgi:hypothetical protein
VLKKKAKSAHNTLKSPPKAALAFSHVDPKARKAREAASLRSLKDLGSDGEESDSQEQDLPDGKFDSEDEEVSKPTSHVLKKNAKSMHKTFKSHSKPRQAREFASRHSMEDGKSDVEANNVQEKDIPGKRYVIESVLRTRTTKDGKKKCLVHWKGYVLYFLSLLL